MNLNYGGKSSGYQDRVEDDIHEYSIRRVKLESCHDNDIENPNFFSTSICSMKVNKSWHSS